MLKCLIIPLVIPSIIVAVGSLELSVTGKIGVRCPEFCWHLGRSGRNLFLKNNFIYLQFSVSQFTWQIWQTNNSIKSNKPHRITKKVWMLRLGLKKSLLSPRFKLMAQAMAQCTDVQSRVWYHSVIQAAQEVGNLFGLTHTYCIQIVYIVTCNHTGFMCGFTYTHS